MYKIKVFLLYMLLTITTSYAKTSENHEISDTCLQEIAIKCPNISLEKLLDHDFLEQLAHDPVALKICSYLRCIKDINNLDKEKLTPNG